MQSLATVPLLIIDDFGMRKLPLTAAEDLLEIVMRRYDGTIGSHTNQFDLSGREPLKGSAHELLPRVLFS